MNLDSYETTKKIYEGIFRVSYYSEADKCNVVEYIVSKRAMLYFHEKFQEYSSKHYDNNIEGYIYRETNSNDWVKLAYELYKRGRNYFNYNNLSNNAYEMYLEYHVGKEYLNFRNETKYIDKKEGDKSLKNRIAKLKERNRKLKENNNREAEEYCSANNILELIDEAKAVINYDKLHEERLEVCLDSSSYNIEGNRYYNRGVYNIAIYYYIQHIVESLEDNHSSIFSSVIYNIGVALIKLGELELAKKFTLLACNLGCDCKKIYNYAYLQTQLKDSNIYINFKRALCYDNNDNDSIKALSIIENDIGEKIFGEDCF